MSIDKKELKHAKATMKAAKAMHAAADALTDWYRAAGEAGFLCQNSREGRDQRLSLSKELREYAAFAEERAEKMLEKGV